MSIDYARMKRESPKLKAALTRATKTGDAEKVIAACRAAVTVWNEVGAWPDNWNLWQGALDDVLGWRSELRLNDL